MATVLPHPESLFLSAAERGLTTTTSSASQSSSIPSKPASSTTSANSVNLSNLFAPSGKATASVDDKIKRLRKKRELAIDLQDMIAQSGLTIEELREALSANANKPLST